MPKTDFVYSDPSTFREGETPYGTYDSDADFQADLVKVTKWVAKRLGHPVMQLEMNSGSIYACFEEAISEYSTQINNYNIKNWMWNSYGSETTGSGMSDASNGNRVQHPNMGTSVVLSERYGEYAGVGGNTELKSGSITMVSQSQTYDLQTLWANVSESGKRIEIQNVYNYGPAAISKFYDPYAGTYDQRSMLDSFGFGNVSPAVSLLLRPVYQDISRASQIETSDKVRKSAYSFHISDNKLQIFPRPTAGDEGNKIWFEYYVRDDVMNTTASYTEGKVSDPSNVPYKFITYNKINSSGRQWIRKYALGLSKELLGIIRSKYSSMPLPNGEVTMDGESLKSEGREEQSTLIEQLNEFLESVSLTTKAQAEADEAEANSKVLSRSPLGIYIG